MTKRILSVLAMMSIAAMMMLSSCSDIGTETGTETGTNTDCSLIGKWEYSKDGYTTTVEITADDKLIVIGKYEVAGEKKENKTEYTITEVSDKEIFYESNNQEFKVAYSDLSRDTVKFNDVEYKKVDDIGTETGTNTDCSLIGKWEYSTDGYTTTVEITADDKIIVTVKYEVAGEKKESKSEGTIKSVSDKEVTYEVDGKEAKVEYSDLGCDTVKFGDVEYKKVY